MNCEAIRKLLHAYSDGELDLAHVLEVETHARDCAGCAQQLRFNSSLRTALSSGGLYARAPKNLGHNIRVALQHEAGLDARLSMTQPAAIPQATFWNWQSLGFALAGVFAVLLFFSITAGRRRNNSENLLAQEVVSAHVRSLMGSHLMDVPSTDQHTVKPWFDGKLDFSPPVTDLGPQGFPLVGGRLDYIENHPAAALVYGRRRHFINLFIWPAEPDRDVAPRSASKQGYNVICWSRSAMNYCAVSDVNAGDLQEFTQLVQK